MYTVNGLRIGANELLASVDRELVNGADTS